MSHLKHTLFAVLIIVSISLLSFTSAEDDNWKEVKSLNGITVYYKTDKCKVQSNKEADYFVFKYVNSNNYNVKVSYKLNLWIGDNCRSCDLPSPSEYDIDIVLQASQTLEFSCNDDNKGLKLYKPKYNKEYNNSTRFEFENFQVNKIK